MLEGGGRGEEGARTGRGNGNSVAVTRWSRAAHLEPVMAHNMAKKIRTAMVRLDRVADNIVL